MRLAQSALLAIGLLFCGTIKLCSQVNATGTFSGQVADPSGGAVSNAVVNVTDQGTGIVVSTKTASDGNYTASLLKPGTYWIEVSAPGFSMAVRKDMTLQIQQVVQQDFTLQVGDVQEQVTVEGGAPLLHAGQRQ